MRHLNSFRGSLLGKAESKGRMETDKILVNLASFMMWSRKLWEEWLQESSIDLYISCYTPGCVFAIVLKK